MPALCTVFATRRAAPSVDALAAAAGGAEVELCGAEGAAWEAVTFRWPGLELTVRRMGAESERLGEQREALRGFLLHCARGAPPSPRAAALLAKAAWTQQVFGVVAEPGPEAGRSDPLVRALAEAVYGVVLRDGRLFDPALRLLLAPGGESDPQAEVPYSPAARERKRRIEERMERAGLGRPPDLPPLPGEDEAAPRPASEIAARAQALFAVAAKAEGLADHEQATALLRERGLWEAATPAERAFLEREAPSAVERQRFAARREALAALLWALGHLPSLPAPTLPARMEGLVGVLRRSSAVEFVARAELGPLPALLDAADLSYRCHGLVALAARAGQEPPGGLLPDVVRERHAAFFWSLRIQEGGWDRLAD